MSEQCPHATDCVLFQKFSVSSALRAWQVFFCEARFLECERFKRMAVEQSVPPTLLPDGTDLSEGAG